MDFKLSDFTTGPWYKILGGIGVLFLLGGVFVPAEINRPGVLFLGGAMITFSFARDECMTTQSRIIDTSVLPSGVPSLIAKRPVHRLTATGAALYAASAVMGIVAAVRFAMA